MARFHLKHLCMAWFRAKLVLGAGPWLPPLRTSVHRTLKLEETYWQIRMLQRFQQDGILFCPQGRPVLLATLNPHLTNCDALNIDGPCSVNTSLHLHSWTGVKIDELSRSSQSKIVYVGTSTIIRSSIYLFIHLGLRKRFRGWKCRCPSFSSVIQMSVRTCVCTHGGWLGYLSEQGGLLEQGASMHWNKCGLMWWVVCRTQVSHREYRWAQAGQSSKWTALVQWIGH